MLCIPVFTVQHLKPLKFELIISRKFDKISPFIPAFFIVFASYENVLL